MHGNFRPRPCLCGPALHAQKGQCPCGASRWAQTSRGWCCLRRGLSTAQLRPESDRQTQPDGRRHGHPLREHSRGGLPRRRRGQATRVCVFPSPPPNGGLHPTSTVGAGTGGRKTSPDGLGIQSTPRALRGAVAPFQRHGRRLRAGAGPGGHFSSGRNSSFLIEF